VCLRRVSLHPRRFLGGGDEPEAGVEREAGWNEAHIDTDAERRAGLSDTGQSLFVSPNAPTRGGLGSRSAVPAADGDERSEFKEVGRGSDRRADLAAGPLRNGAPDLVVCGRRGTERSLHPAARLLRHPIGDDAYPDVRDDLRLHARQWTVPVTLAQLFNPSPHGVPLPIHPRRATDFTSMLLRTTHTAACAGP
jgi:hypothetical protein